MLNFLSDNTAIVTLLLLTLLFLALLGVIIWAAVKGAEKQDKPADQKPRLISADSLKLSFRRAVELIEANLADRAERYNLPWTLILNEGQQGRELPLVQSGLQSALSADSTLTAAAQGISWNFFDKGVAVQLQSDYLGSPDPDAPGNNNTWDDFLGLCRNYRPDRPFDSIVLSIPAAAFLQNDSQGQLDLAARAKAIHRRLWLAQNRLALRFPIYLAIADCESIPGFAAFAAALPEPMQRSILGWSSPYELVAPFQAGWIDAAMNEVVRSLSDTCSELCALEAADADSTAYFMLPNEVERLRAGLKLFTEELMRPSAYHEPFLLRGLYLTGDCSDAAALMDDGEAKAQSGVPMEAPDSTSDLLESPDFPAIAPPAALMLGQSSAVPAFLRDIFERKIFAEGGLVRSSSVQRTRRPAMSRVVQWTAIAVPVIWLGGIAVGAVQLHGLSSEVVVYLKKLDRDARANLLAASRNVVDPAQSRQRALEALQNIEQMDGTHLSSVFMPGSWSMFENLHKRVQDRLERGFAENSFEPMRRAAYQQIGTLTGVPLDPVSGNMIVGGACTLPGGWQEQTANKSTGALNIEDLPEFGATLQYVARMEELDRALQAMMRLKATSGPAAGEDLALVVRVLLGAELNGNPARTAALFRQVAQGVPSLTIEPMQEAAACTLRLAMKATYERLYVNNGLLKSEQAIAQIATALFDAAPNSTDVAAHIEVWQGMLASMRNQEAYLDSGKGAWMRRRTLQLGQAHDALLAKVQAVSLLGVAAASDAQKQAEEGFIKFLTAWDPISSVDNFAQSGSGGLVWNEEASSWTFSPERKEQLATLNLLLSQSYMKINSLSKFPDVPVGATVAWDRARLDQALALADARKRFQTDLQPKFPALLQTSVADLVDDALAQTAGDLLSQAFIVSTREVQAPATEADRTRTLKLRAWLQELGAETVAEQLSSVLTKDAVTRLQMLDNTFNRSEVFVPRDREFRSWRGEKMPLLDAFGAGDASNLAAYVAQQQSFIDATGKEADALLMQLGSAQPGNALVARWQAMVADLGRYRLKSPTSSLMTLEQFVLAGAAELDGANCLDKLNARMAQRRAADLFAERLQALQSGLLNRCRDLKQTEYQDTWTSFADAFNRDLANRFPFRPAGGNSDPANQAAALMDRAAADLEEVGRVLKLFDRAHAAGGAWARDPQRPAGGLAVRRVDEQMQKVRDFFAPLYPADESQVAGLDVTVEFRANQNAEIEGNKIIDWSLTVGSQTLRQRDAPRALRWEPGAPLVFAVRLARDGPVTPKAEPGNAQMVVDDRSVAYRFEDPWALMSFIAQHREMDVPAGTDARSQLLRFEFPITTANENPRLPPKESRARVFVRLAVSPAGKRAPLAWPAVIPVRVPVWGSQ